MIDTYDKFKEYVLRKLGAPVIMINLDDKQIEDSIGDAIQHFCEYHRDGSETHYHAYTTTADDFTNGYIPIPASTGIDDVVQLLSSNGIQGIGQWHTPSWQAASSIMSVKSSFATIRLTDYVLMNERISNMNQVLGTPCTFTYNKYKRRLIPKFDFNEGDIIAMECYQNVDPRVAGNEEAYDDLWLKKYATACVKERWGNVLTMMSNVKLPGGIELDGNKMLMEAQDEKAKLEEELQKGHQEPVNFFIG
ncbi:coil containing protein [Vibrio phage 1.244.A._10N.261.54.C3]|nr:coil containing protein [Vibrio phage 1.244.A._10N.261.54.C3]AUR98837.1 coil containing protein [Vibrio phage 1.255.O._10N.286.45.F1]